MTVEEWPALRLRYGFQVSEERPEENVNGRDLVPGVSAVLTAANVVWPRALRWAQPASTKASSDLAGCS